MMLPFGDVSLQVSTLYGYLKSNKSPLDPDDTRTIPSGVHFSAIVTKFSALKNL